MQVASCFPELCRNNVLSLMGMPYRKMPVSFWNINAFIASIHHKVVIESHESLPNMELSQLFEYRK